MGDAGFIDGAFVAGEGEELAVEDPSSEELFARFPGLSAAQVDAAILSARRAFDSGVWSGLEPIARADALRRLVAALAARNADLAPLLSRETGCPLHSPSMTVQLAQPQRQMLEAIGLFLDLPETEDNPLPFHQRVTPQGGVIQSVRRYTPIGVVAAIAAYNYPLLTALWKIVPALIAGNTVVLRPSPLTPLATLALGLAAAEAELPPGVLNIVVDAGTEGGRIMSSHPAVDMVAFTGSSGVGTRIMAQAAPTMKRLQLELGGKSAQIFLPDMVDRVALAATGACTAHAGQGCAIGTRIFVPDDSIDRVMDEIAQSFSTVRIGPADDPETRMGPVISAAQRTRCEAFTALAVEHGGRVITGGTRPAHLDRGYFYEPTALHLPDNANPAAQEEIFGPVLAVIGYRDLDHAVAMANDSKFGLSGYVLGKDKALALKVGLAIRSGTVNVNAGIMSSYISSGGHRMSGIGRERGVEGLRIYQQQSCINLGG